MTEQELLRLLNSTRPAAAAFRWSGPDSGKPRRSARLGGRIQVAAVILFAMGLGFFISGRRMIPAEAPDPTVRIGRSQDSPSEAPGTWVDRFVAGEDGASAKIRSFGPGTLELLRPHRKSARVRDLIRLIRESAATPEDRRLSERLSGLTSKGQGSRRSLPEALVAALGTQVHFAIDPRGAPEFDACDVTIPKGGSSLDVLEDVCAEANADFAFLYGIVLVARPERLWPALPPEERPLTEAGRARARMLVDQLGSERPEERDKASVELRNFGRPVLAVLETGTTRPDPELSGRCRRLIQDLSPKPRTVFAVPAAERQEDELPRVSTLKEKAVTFKVRDLPLKTAFSLLFSQNNALWNGKLPDIHCTFGFENVPPWAILAIVTQCHDLDFLIENGCIVIGPRQEIIQRVQK